MVLSFFLIMCPVNRWFQYRRCKQEVFFFFKTMFTPTSLSYFSLICSGRDGSGAGAVDEEDFIQAFEDVPTVQVERVPSELDYVGRVDQIIIIIIITNN